MFPRMGSLQARLITRLVVLYSALVGLIFFSLVYQATETAERLSDRELSRRVADIASHLRAEGPDGLRLRLPPELAATYSATTRVHLFAIWAQDGRVVATSHPEIANLVNDWPRAGADPDYFVLENFGPDKAEYYGMVEDVRVGSQTFSIMVAQARDLKDLIDAIVDEFIADVSWVLALAVFATIVICVWTIRLGMRPLVEISEVAKRVAPGTLDLRLRADRIPDEVLPLVTAVNNALDRLQEGYESQRRFTADAAHELRTPLSILRARIEQSAKASGKQAFREDIDRMAGVIEQLLRLAHIEGAAFRHSEPVELAALTERIVAEFAPLALAAGRRIGLDRPAKDVTVLAEAEALAVAIGNLIKNALWFTREGTEVQVTVAETGSVTVRDFGIGVDANDRSQIFKPFWKGREGRPGGTGLGLAIVAETARRFGGRVDVENAAGGGARFILSLPLCEPREDVAVAPASEVVKLS